MINFAVHLIFWVVPVMFLSILLSVGTGHGWRDGLLTGSISLSVTIIYQVIKEIKEIKETKEKPKDINIYIDK